MVEEREEGRRRRKEEKAWRGRVGGGGGRREGETISRSPGFLIQANPAAQAETVETCTAETASC